VHEAARAVSFFLDGNDSAILPLVGDGLLPADIDGKQKPKDGSTIRSSARRTTTPPTVRRSTR